MELRNERNKNKNMTLSEPEKDERKREDDNANNWNGSGVRKLIMKCNFQIMRLSIEYKRFSSLLNKNNKCDCFKI